MLERFANAHGFADRLHLGAERAVGQGEFLEREAGDFSDHVIDGRLEAGRGFTRDVIADFVQGVADGEFGGELRDREPGRLGCQCTGARHARVHLDDDQASVVGMERELHVGAAGIDADFAHDRNGGVAQPLVFAVGQRLRRRHGDAVARVYAHGVDVFDRADDDDVVLAVAHDLQFELFPAQNGLFDQHFGDRAVVQAALDDGPELFLVERDPAAGAAKGEPGADDHRVGADLALHAQRLVQRPRRAALGHFEPDFLHGLLEEQAFLGASDDLGFGADHFDLVPGQDAAVVQGHGQVQGGLTPDGRQERIRPFAGNDGLEHGYGERFDVGALGELRVGHDGGRIAVDEDDLVPLFAQGLAGLSARVVELAGLADDDGAGADQQDFRDVVASRHAGDILSLGLAKVAGLSNTRGFRFRVSGVRCQVSGVRCRVSGVGCQVSGVRCRGDRADNGRNGPNGPNGRGGDASRRCGVFT